MKTITKTVLAIGIAIGVVAIGGMAAVYSGVYNVGADDPHTRPVYQLLETARRHSVAARADRLQVPADLNDPARIRQGAGNYEAMCTGCHLSPGAAATELSKGLYPAPPDLTKNIVDAGTAFWTIKHGIKASGMPAWGKSMEDEYIWNIAAFLQELPKLDKAQYTALVASSGGHSHGGGETGGHSHADGMDDHHEDTGDHDHAEGADDHHEGMDHDGMPGMTDTKAPVGDEVHTHADGSQHVHAPAATKPAESTKPAIEKPTADPHAGTSMSGTEVPEQQPASDGDDHQH